MRVLALDQASRVTGWAVYDDKRLYAYGKISATHSDIGDRLYHIRQQVIQLINEYDIGEVVFEDIQLQDNKINNVATFKTLAEVFGVLHELFVELKLPREAVLSTVWKSKLGLKGYDRTTQKRAAQAWVKEKFNISPTQDECDAICIGYYYTQHRVETFDWSE